MSWNVLRQRALKVAEFKCCQCGGTESLVVHHRKYPAYTLNDVEVLCTYCHNKIHFGKKPINWNKSKLEKHCKKGKTLREMANIYNTSYERIRQKLLNFDLNTNAKLTRIKRSITEPRMVHFSKEDMQLIKKAAKRKGINVTTLIRMAISNYLE